MGWTACEISSISNFPVQTFLADVSPPARRKIAFGSWSSCPFISGILQERGLARQTGYPFWCQPNSAKSACLFFYLLVRFYFVPLGIHYYKLQGSTSRPRAIARTLQLWKELITWLTWSGERLSRKEKSRRKKYVEHREKNKKKEKKKRVGITAASKWTAEFKKATSQGLCKKYKSYLYISIDKKERKKGKPFCRLRNLGGTVYIISGSCKVSNIYVHRTVNTACLVLFVLVDMLRFTFFLAPTPNCPFRLIPLTSEHLFSCPRLPSLSEVV